MNGIGEIFTWGVPEFLPVTLTDMEIWEFVIPLRTNIAETGIIRVTEERDNNSPLWQLLPGSNVTLHIRSFALYKIDSTLSELETRIDDIFGSGRVLATETQNLSSCDPAAQLTNTVNIFTAPAASLLTTNYTIDHSGSGTLCPGGRRLSLNIRLFVNSGSIIDTNSKNIGGTVYTPVRIN